jgi:glycosyltransferase involved in cell wall biosynthesis
MKVLVDDAFFCIGKSGIARVWLEVMKAISRTRLDKKFSLEILILNRTGNLQNLGFLEIGFPPYDQSNAHADRLLIDKVVEHYEIDVFISSYYTWTTSAVNLGVFHDFIPEVFGFQQINESWQQRVVYCHVVDGVFCVSQNTLDDGLTYYKRFEALPKLVSHPGSSHAIDFLPYSNSTPMVPPNILGKVAAGKPFLMTVGLGPAEYKNRRLLELIVTSKECPVNFLTVGGLELDSKTVNLAGALGTSIVHLSDASDEELFAWAANSAGLFFPSLYEGFGLPVAEFIQLGLPVITSNNSALPEASNGEAIYISGEDPHEAILAIMKMIGNQSLKPRLRSIREPRTWESFADDLLQFAQLLGVGTNAHLSLPLKEDSILASTKIPFGH